MTFPQPTAILAFTGFFGEAFAVFLVISPSYAVLRNILKTHPKPYIRYQHRL
jgi:hypothetical protein